MCVVTCLVVLALAASGCEKRTPAGGSEVPGSGNAASHSARAGSKAKTYAPDSEEPPPRSAVEALREHVFIDPLTIARRCAELGAGDDSQEGSYDTSEMGDYAKRVVEDRASRRDTVALGILKSKLPGQVPVECSNPFGEPCLRLVGLKLASKSAGPEAKALAAIVSRQGRLTTVENLREFLRRSTNLSRPVLITGLYVSTWLEDRTAALADNSPLLKGALRFVLQLVAAHVLSYTAVLLVRRLERKGVHPLDVAQDACELVLAGGQYGPISQRFLRTAIVRFSKTPEKGDYAYVCKRYKNKCREVERQIQDDVGLISDHADGIDEVALGVVGQQYLALVDLDSDVESLPLSQSSGTLPFDERDALEIMGKNEWKKWEASALAHAECGMRVLESDSSLKVAVQTATGACALMGAAGDSIVTDDDTTRLLQVSEQLGRMESLMLRAANALERVEPLLAKQESARERLASKRQAFESLRESVQSGLTAPGLTAEVVDGGESVTFSVASDSALFETRKADVPNAVKVAVKAVAKLLLENPQLGVTVSGFHDGEPITSAIPVRLNGKQCAGCVESNLELATVRALNVAGLLLKEMGASMDHGRVQVSARSDNTGRRVDFTFFLLASQ